MLKNILILRDEIEEELPTGGDWHKKLLRFRHLTRNIYGFQLNLERFEHLINNLTEVSNKLNKQVISFLNSMENIAKKADKEK